jgi:thiamine pyrophosphokinase
MPAKEVEQHVPRRAPGAISAPGVPFVVSRDRTSGERGGRMRIVVVASGDLADGDDRWLDAASAVIAADGGAESLDRLGRTPRRLVGDLDSISGELLERLSSAGVVIDRHPADKDASDTELAIQAAIDAGATEIVVLGATGGARLDHELANVLLLADPALAAHDVRIVRGPTTLRVLRAGGRLALGGAAGDLVSLLPIGGDAVGVVASGVRWPLRSATLGLGRSRGLSNEVIEPPASVSLEDGTLLVVEHRVQGEPI